MSVFSKRCITIMLFSLSIYLIYLFCPTAINVNNLFQLIPFCQLTKWRIFMYCLATKVGNQKFDFKFDDKFDEKFEATSWNDRPELQPGSHSTVLCLIFNHNTGFTGYKKFTQLCSQQWVFLIQVIVVITTIQLIPHQNQNHQKHLQNWNMKKRLIWESTSSNLGI